jgi:hypothetical protein
MFCHVSPDGVRKLTCAPATSPDEGKPPSRSSNGWLAYGTKGATTHHTALWLKPAVLAYEVFPCRRDPTY